MGSCLPHWFGGGSPGANAGSVFTEEIAIGKSLLYAILYLLSCLFQFRRAELLHYNFCLLTGRFLAFLSVDRCEHLGHKLSLGHENAEVAVVITVAVALALLITLVPSHLGHFLRLCLHQLVEVLLYSASYQLLDFTLIYERGIPPIRTVYFPPKGHSLTKKKGLQNGYSQNSY